MNDATRKLRNDQGIKFAVERVYEIRTATPANDVLAGVAVLVFSDILQSITQRCPESHLVSLKARQTCKTTEFYLGGLDLQYRTQQMGFPSREIEKENFGVSQEKQIQTAHKESFEPEVLSQKQHNAAVAFASWFRKLACLDLSTPPPSNDPTEH